MDIELKELKLKFQDKIIFDNFCLKIEDGDKIFISGNSGKGKSTLFRILMGFQRIESGSYMLNKKDYKDYNIANVREKFAYVDQDISLRKLNVQEYLDEISKFHHNTISNKIDNDLCKYFNFDKTLLDKNMQLLSGGERQRLAIIIAIMLDRPCFLLDEITSALDKNLKKSVVNYFENTKKTVIVISHDNQWLENDKFRSVVL